MVESRRWFARLCVQINFDEPITKLLKVGGIDQLVYYESISSLCFACGCIGHKTESCPYKVKAPERNEGEKEAGSVLERKD